jgi:acyl transferase domain-containing protein
VNLSLHPNKFVGLSRAGVIASRRDSRSFGDGDGYLPAEGVGAVLLKPLSQAVRDGDEILAVIKSTATNHGGYANGFSVPNPKAQAQLIIDNCIKSGIDPRAISYIESAANGSALGDALEMTALNTAFARFTRDRGFCAIGSVKSNIGHPEAASGMAQLAKVIMQLRYGQLVPSIQATPLNPKISFADTPFYVQETLREWPRPRLEVTGPDGRRVEREVPRRAAINSFGAGGSNAHLIMEEYVPAPRGVAARLAQEAALHIVVFSAKSPGRLRALIRRMLDFLVTATPAPAFADLAYTLQVGREAMTSRLAMVVREWTELLRGMATFLAADGSPEAASIPMFVGNTAEDQGLGDVLALGDLLASAAVRQEFLNERNLEKLALYWTRGGEIPWAALHVGEPPRLITLPTYPFAREWYWLATSAPEHHPEPTVERALELATPAETARARVQAFLLHFLAQELHLTPEQVRLHRDLRDYGADSITAMRLRRAVENEFHVHMAGRDLLEHHTLHALSTYLAARLDAYQAAGTADAAAVQSAAPDALEQFKQGILTLEDMEALLEQGKVV